LNLVLFKNEQGNNATQQLRIPQCQELESEAAQKQSHSNSAADFLAQTNPMEARNAVN